MRIINDDDTVIMTAKRLRVREHAVGGRRLVRFVLVAQNFSTARPVERAALGAFRAQYRMLPIRPVSRACTGRGAAVRLDSSTSTIRGMEDETSAGLT